MSAEHPDVFVATTAEKEDYDLRQHLNAEYQSVYDRHFNVALRGTAELQQAHAIARQKTLDDVLRASAAKRAVTHYDGPTMIVALLDD